jgi:D-tyrosyl-tRNA(Tyr) deacylase
MIALIQRVTQASVQVAGEECARIAAGMAVLIGVLPADTQADAQTLLTRLLHYRIFADADDRMNLSLKDTGGGLLLVPQFTLAADTRKGLRPGFSGAAPPEQGKRLFEHLVQIALQQHGQVQSGVFGANMQLSLTNDGPATFWLEHPVRPG